jgi:hypothetical protein
MHRNERIKLASLLLMAALSPAVAQAQVLTVRRAEIAATVEWAMECYLHPNGTGCPVLPLESRPACSLYWASASGSPDRVKVSRLSSRAVNADVHMKCAINNFWNPHVYIRLDLVFSCFWRYPSVKVSPGVDVEVNWPWYVDVATASVTWWIGNIASRTATSQVRASGALQALVQERMIPINYCPGINVQSNGDVRIDLGMGTACTNGQTNHRRCSGNYDGPGVDYLCVGGRWEVAGGVCEPTAPPGGQRP